MSTLLDERPDTKPSHGGKDPDEPEVAHYALKAQITDAYIFGTEIEALCGEKFIPTRDPERYPVCEACVALLDQMFPE
jgi:hypothetical protein